MRRLLVSLLALPLALIAPTPVALADSGSALDFLDRSFEASNVPGMAVAVTDGEEIVLARGYGVDARGEPMTSSTPLRVASMTKTVTAVAVHQLADDGRIALDDPVVQHLPEFRMRDPRHASITIQQLLDNRSGLTDGQFDLERLNRSGSLKEYVAGLREAELASEPGAAQAYCNVNWEILARMIEVVSRQPYARYLEDRIFAPLGMRDSTVDLASADPPGGFQELFGFHFAREDRVLFAASSGSNGLITTADDLARWTRWVASGSGGDILDPGTREAMIERARREGGTDGFEGTGERTGKSGMQHTELSFLRISPDRALGVTVVFNHGDIANPPYAVADGTLDVMEGRVAEPVGSGWRATTASYVVVGLAGATAAVFGVRRAGAWAGRRRRGRSWVTVLRLLWLALPAVALAALPWLASALTMGTRTVTWAQITYLVLTPFVVLATLSVGGLVVLAARLVAMRSEFSDEYPGADQLAGGEAEDRSHGVAEVRGRGEARIR